MHKRTATFAWAEEEGKRRGRRLETSRGRVRSEIVPASFYIPADATTKVYSQCTHTQSSLDRLKPEADIHDLPPSLMLQIHLEHPAHLPNHFLLLLLRKVAQERESKRLQPPRQARREGSDSRDEFCERSGHVGSEGRRRTAGIDAEAGGFEERAVRGGGGEVPRVEGGGVVAPGVEDRV